MKIKNIHIFGGGTFSHVASHLSVCAPAFGETAKQIHNIITHDPRFQNFNVHLELTKMAGGSDLVTNKDVYEKVSQLKQNFNTKIIFFNCALVDYEVDFYRTYKYDAQNHLDIDKSNTFEIGKYEPRFETRKNPCIDIGLSVAEKVIPNIRSGRKDIFLVGFKATCGATKQEMYEKGLRLCKEGSVNLVLVNDTKTRWNMIVTPEEASYHETDNRIEILYNLVNMAYHRSHLTFTQSTVVDGKPIEWSDERIPSSLRTVVNHCISKNAYKPFNGSTVGHFAVKLSDTEFLTSIRKSNLNDLDKNGMVYVKTDGPDTVLAYGAKPSVGGQSQRIVFNDHEGMDCIVHFHSPLKENNPDQIPIVSQEHVECGSHQCGKNTSDNLKTFVLNETTTVKVVMLDKHGPNIVFSKTSNPHLIIDFIERNFDLSQKTGGYNFDVK